METIALLKKLTEATGITGSEDAVRDLVRKTWRPLVDEVEEGKLGSLIARQGGTGPDDQKRPRIMLAAHMDEIGLRVTKIEEGFLRVARVGGTDRRVLLGTEVLVHGQTPLPGLVATRPPHVLPKEERKKTVPWDKIFVDVGLPAEEIKAQVSIGDLISIRREMTELKNERVAGKAMDDRSCVAILTLVLDQLRKMAHYWDVFAVATVQEEIGLIGATTSAYGVAPDLGIALDVGFAKSPGVNEYDTHEMGKGPLIGVGPNFHPGFVDRLKRVADSHEIPYQIDPVPGRCGTDSWAIQVTRQGVPTALISLPIRYMHQPVEMLAVQDVDRAARLVATFIAELEPDFLDHVTWERETS